MSRVRRLKERKNKIKAAFCGLALTLAIGSVQGLGTYALFTDTEDIASNLAISTGEVDVHSNVEQCFQGEEIEDTDGVSKTFNISNNGTLRQKLQLQFELTEDINNITDEELNSINYSLSMKYGNRTIEPINLNFYEIKYGKDKQGKEVDLEVDLEYYGSTEKVILNPGDKDKIECTSRIWLDSSYNQDGEEYTINFNLNILASQVVDENSPNYEEHIGFTDLYNQNNSISIKYELKPNLDGVKLEQCGMSKYKNSEIYIPIKIPRKYKYIDISGTGAFKNVYTCGDIHNGYINIVKDRNRSSFISGENAIGSDFSEDNKLVIKVVQNNGSLGEKTLTWEIKFRYNNGKLEAYYTYTEKINKQQGAEVEVSDESDVVNQLKEEVEVPSKPEVVEPSKVEEAVVPSQTDIITQRKEEIEMQE